MMKKLTYILLIIFAATSLNLVAVHAAPDSAKDEIKEIIPPKPDNLPGPSKEDFEKAGASRILTASVLPKLTVYLIGIVAGVSVLFLVISGVRFATAYGNEEDTEKAKNQAVYAVVGIVLALLAYTIVQVILNIKFG